jgi:hypothetical protein
MDEISHLKEGFWGRKLQTNVGEKSSALKHTNQ